MAHRELVFAGDIGGTKTNLALYSVHGDKLRSESMQTFPSKRYSGLVPVLQDFLGSAQPKIDGLPVEHRQGARQSQTHRADVRVGRRAKPRRAATEDFGGGEQLGVDFQPDNGLVGHPR